ncbi:MAG: hypothetical protein HYX48_01875 [Chlamydiales bacterium]|nr:hypothetical protein [Chlamydiales bacterium]
MSGISREFRSVGSCLTSASTYLGVYITSERNKRPAPTEQPRQRPALREQQSQQQQPRPFSRERLNLEDQSRAAGSSHSRSSSASGSAAAAAAGSSSSMYTSTGQRLSSSAASLPSFPRASGSGAGAGAAASSMISPDMYAQSDRPSYDEDGDGPLMESGEYSPPLRARAREEVPVAMRVDDSVGWDRRVIGSLSYAAVAILSVIETLFRTFITMILFVPAALASFERGTNPTALYQASVRGTFLTAENCITCLVGTVVSFSSERFQYDNIIPSFDDRMPIWEVVHMLVLGRGHGGMDEPAYGVSDYRPGQYE